MSLSRFAAIAALPALLMGCAAEEIWATEEEVTKSSYTHEGPTSLTLVNRPRRLQQFTAAQSKCPSGRARSSGSRAMTHHRLLLPQSKPLSVTDWN